MGETRIGIRKREKSVESTRKKRHLDNSWWHLDNSWLHSKNYGVLQYILRYEQ